MPKIHSGTTSARNTCYSGLKIVGFLLPRILTDLDKYQNSGNIIESIGPSSTKVSLNLIWFYPSSLLLFIFDAIFQLLIWQLGPPLAMEICSAPLVISFYFSIFGSQHLPQPLYRPALLGDLGFLAYF